MERMSKFYLSASVLYVAVCGYIAVMHVFLLTLQGEKQDDMQTLMCVVLLSHVWNCHSQKLWLVPPFTVLSNTVPSLLYQLHKREIMVSLTYMGQATFDWNVSRCPIISYRLKSLKPRHLLIFYNVLSDICNTYKPFSYQIRFF